MSLDSYGGIYIIKQTGLGISPIIILGLWQLPANMWAVLCAHGDCQYDKITHPLCPNFLQVWRLEIIIIYTNVIFLFSAKDTANKAQRAVEKAAIDKVAADYAEDLANAELINAASQEKSKY